MKIKYKRMKKLFFFFAVATIMLAASCSQSGYQMKQATDNNGYAYSYATNDPFNVRIYTLENGLKVYLSVNKDEPRIETYIPVKAGSTYDPVDNTGLAHYLEHMMFKGTSNIGAMNWEKEKVMLAEISDLYEKHKATDSKEEKAGIYKKIDSVSAIAAGLVAPNEYDKLLASIGAKGTNAYTTNERTVYMNNIPSNELDKWLQIESDRFFDNTLRLFHTEIEAVYEEFNMSQDNDNRKAYYATFNALFPGHPYGEQTTLGKGEHLKNPSMEAIKKYYSTYYVPNNMAICLSGDLDPEKTIQLIDKHFGKFEKKPVPPIQLGKAEAVKSGKPIEVYGPDAEFMYMGYRFGGIGSEDQKFVRMIDMVLNNSKAGLIDLNLVQKQKVQYAGSMTNFLNDYGLIMLYGGARQGQTLEDVQTLLQEQIEKIKAGDFDDWLLKAIINDMKLGEIRAQEQNSRAHKFAIAFANNQPWNQVLSATDELATITKEQLVAFANEHLNDDYITVFKRNGEANGVMKVEKPVITPVNLNRDNVSEFFKKIENQKPERLSPAFLDYKAQIVEEELGKGVNFAYIKNPTNKLFKLMYIVEMGKDHNKKLAHAVNYLEYLGTDKYTAAEFQQELFKYGLSFGVSTADDKSYVYMSGLEENAGKALELIEHLLANVKADEQAYSDYVTGIEKDRADQKLNKGHILRVALQNYAKYGEKSSFTDILSIEALRAIDPNELVGLIKGITSFEHEVFYYGQNDMNAAKQLVAQYHKIPAEVKPVPEPTKYPEKEITEPVVYFVDYDMVQTNLLMMSKDEKLDTEIIPQTRLFNQFYGDVVFQEIRESRALAYTAYSYFSTPAKRDDSHYNISYVATQVDKLQNATSALKELLTEIPAADKLFENSKESLMKKIETERIIKDQVFWNYVSAKERGLDYDVRKDVYNYVKNADMQNFKSFFASHISNKPLAYCVIGKKELMDFSVLKKLGKVKELTLEEIYNY
jgi:predicted Zn-dependent peptidase